MVEVGYSLSSEAHGPQELIETARQADEAGFEFAVLSALDRLPGPDGGEGPEGSNGAVVRPNRFAAQSCGLKGDRRP